MARKKSRTGDSIIDSWIEDELDSTARELQQAMKITVGVDTGALRDSITIEERNGDRYVGVDSDLLITDPRNERGRDYTKYHHDGTFRNRANPFLDIAMNMVGK